MTFLSVFGHTNLDIIMNVERLPEHDQSTPVRSRQIMWGGTAGNLARAAGKLGVSVRLASFVGDDFPDDYRKALDDDHVDLQDLRVLPGTTTPTVWVFNDLAKQQCYVIDMGAMDRTDLFEDMVAAATSSDWVHLCTGDPDYLLRMGQLAKEASKQVAFDPGQEVHWHYTQKQLNDMLDLADMAWMNRRELATMLKLIGKGSKDDLLELVPEIVLTRGVEGALHLARDSHEIHIGSYKVDKVIDPTGAGDGFRAGYYAALSKDMSWTDCMKAGASAASYIIESEGAQTRLPTWGHVESRMGMIG